MKNPNRDRSAGHPWTSKGSNYSTDCTGNQGNGASRKAFSRKIRLQVGNEIVRKSL